MEFLKALFDAAESGVLSYDGLVKACEAAGIKPVNLASGGYVSENKYKDELAAKQTTIDTLNTNLSTRENDIADLQKKLADAGNDSQKLSEISNELESLKSKYKTDTDKLNAQLKDQSKRFAVREYVSGKKFTSNAAKRDFENYLLSKEFEVQDGKIMGGDDYVAAYTKDNADAFVVEKHEETKPQQPQPSFVQKTSGEEKFTQSTGEFKWNFTPINKKD